MTIPDLGAPFLSVAALAHPPHTLLGLLSRVWAYVALGATSIVTEEVAPVVAGFAAHQGHLGLVRAGMACAIGSWSADIGLYALGRWRAIRMVRRWPKLSALVRKLLRVVRRHPWRASVAVRYAYGARLTLPITCGAARVPLGVYLAGSGLSAFSWSAIFTGLGWIFGESAVLLLGRIRRHEDKLALLMALMVLLIVIVVQIRNRNSVPEEIEGAPVADEEENATREPA